MSSNDLDVPNMAFQRNVEILVKTIYFAIEGEKKIPTQNTHLKWIKKLNMHNI